MQKRKWKWHRNFNPNRAVEMYRAGKGIQEIAYAFGYKKGTGCNRVRYALEKARLFRLRRVRVHQLAGRRFTRLFVLARAGTNKHGFSLWECICNCGNIRIVAAGELVRGDTRSCGCLRREHLAKLRWKHGHAKSGKQSPTYLSWCAMHLRCTNPKAINWDNYGGRGITICERWRGDHGFENFIADVGERPEGHTLDRIEVNGNYEPTNCRWATRVEQRANQREADIIEGDDEREGF